MTDIVGACLLVGSFLFLIVMRAPIAFAIGFSSVITTLYLGLPLEMVAQNMVKGINTFVLLTVPFFILMGEIMSAGGISTRLVAFSNALVGWIRGGMAMVNVVASMFFGGITGSSSADASSIGSMLIPMMRKQGYPGPFSTSVTMAASIQGVLVPPSHNMVLFAMVAGGVSIGQLFLAGIIPGAVLGLSLMAYCYIVSVKNNYPMGEPFSLKNVMKTFKESIWGLASILIVVVAVVSGVFTATESAAIAAIYAFIVTFFVYREVPLSAFNGILTKTIKTLAIIMILIGTSNAFGWLLAYLKVTAMITSGILAISHNPIIVMIIINLIMLVLGTLMDMSAIILIATPILLPIAAKVGVDPVHFGVIMMLNLGIGLLTPPVGSTLFIGSAITGIPITKLTKSLLPFYAVMLVVLVVITYVPSICMYLPKLFMK